MYHILNRFIFGHKSTRCLIGAATGCKLCRFGSFKRACNKQDTRNLLRGRPIFLIRHGKPDQKQMRRLRFTVDDLIDALRQKDVFDLSTVEEAVVETNGSLSVRLRKEESPVTPKQLGVPTPDNGFPIPVVTDGHIVPEYFGDQVLDTAAIAKALQKESLHPGEQLVVTIDDSGTVFAVKKERKK